MRESFQHKKSLGQHFLNSPVVPGWMCDAGRITAADTVFEIGPGTGALTAELLTRGATVVALETDARALQTLAERFAAELAAGQLRLVAGDARRLDLAAYGLTDHTFKIVANIPYYLSGQLFRHCLQSRIQPTALVFLVQKEVAKRATAQLERGEKESLLSLSVKAYGEPHYVKTVGRGHFVPPPAVDSAIISISDINRAAFTDLSQSFFFELLHLGFGQKRKQLLGNLANQFEREHLTHIFSTLGIPVSTRAEDLPLKTWLSLATALAIPN